MGRGTVGLVYDGSMGAHVMLEELQKVWKELPYLPRSTLRVLFPPYPYDMAEVEGTEKGNLGSQETGSHQKEGAMRVAAFSI